MVYTFTFHLLMVAYIGFNALLNAAADDWNQFSATLLTFFVWNLIFLVSTRTDSHKGTHNTYNDAFESDLRQFRSHRIYRVH